MKVEVIGTELRVDGSLLRKPSLDQLKEVLFKAQLRPAVRQNQRITVAVVADSVAEAMTQAGYLDFCNRGMRYDTIEFNELKEPVRTLWAMLLSVGLNPQITSANDGVRLQVVDL